MNSRRTTLREGDLRLAAQLCSNIHNAVKNVLLTAYRLLDDSPYRHVPAVRVLLFTVHEQYKCLRLQLYVSDTSVVGHCKHRFTLDPGRQRHLNPAASAWNKRRLHHVDYEAEYAADPEAYIAEAVQHGFTRRQGFEHHFSYRQQRLGADRAARISLRWAPGFLVSSASTSERRAVFPQETHPVLAEIVVDLLNDFNTGRRSPLQFEDRDIMEDNRGIIDEVTR